MYIQDLCIYPLKSAKGFSVSTLEFDNRGPKFDRHWMVVDNNGKFVTQRHYPTMCLIETAIDNEQLRVSHPTQGEARSVLTGSMCDVTIWKDTVQGEDAGDEIATWVSDFLGKTCRVVFMPTTTQRLVDTVFAKQEEVVGFADGFPTLIATQASLDAFNQHLEKPITMAHFRPNIVIGGADAYQEDEWRQIQTTSMTFNLVKPCSRCIIPSILPDTAEKNMAINKALMEHRRFDGKTIFGQNALHLISGSVEINEAVHVT